MSLSVSLSLSADTAPTAGQSPAAKPVKTEDYPALSCVFFLLLKCLQNQNLEIQTSSDEDVSAAAILFVLLGKKGKILGFISLFTRKSSMTTSVCFDAKRKRKLSRLFAHGQIRDA